MIMCLENQKLFFSSRHASDILQIFFVHLLWEDVRRQFFWELRLMAYKWNGFVRYKKTKIYGTLKEKKGIIFISIAATCSRASSELLGKEWVFVVTHRNGRTDRFCLKVWTLLLFDLRMKETTHYFKWNLSSMWWKRAKQSAIA